MSMLKVIVSRRTWLRGEGWQSSYLFRRADQKMCCLGFACLASGLTSSDIAGITMPGGIEEPELRLKIAPWFPSAFLHHTQQGENPNEKRSVIRKMMSVNDSKLGDKLRADDRERPILGIEVLYTEPQRESLLTQLGKEVGLDLEFVS